MAPDRWQRISALYHAALARGVDERAAFLADVCAEDFALRHEVQSLLEQPTSSDDFLADSVREVAAAAFAPSDASLIGQAIGPYRVMQLLGVGGMGEVYRARDTKLGRDVAVKILPPTFAEDADRLARFAREARLLASLNHPNVAAIYGIEESAGLRALILELVEGESLSARIARSNRSGLPVAEAVAIASQIVDALDAAHEKGIVHRDLKPANIKLTRALVVKLLDFGIAKAWSADAASEATGQAPTILGGRTDRGIILGTAAYMSPEQARGLAVDRRADIWAFGCLLFEMLTGRTSFGAPTVRETIAALLENEPDWRALPATTPNALRRLLRRCLEKDPRRRLRDIADARDSLEESRGPGAEPLDVWSGPAARDVVFRRITDFKGHTESPAVSPDGKMAAFVAVVGGRRQIWIRFLAGGAPLQVTRDDRDHEHPRWAPDSTALIYYTPPDADGDEGAIWEISALGGPARRITSSVGGGDISHDGKRIALFQSERGRPLTLVTVTRGGARATSVALLPAGYTFSSPRWSPDDAAIAFQRASNTAWEACIEIVPSAGGDRFLAVRRASMRGFCWRPDGSGLVYSSSHGSTLRYPPFFNLRVVDRDGRHDRQLTFGDLSYTEPDAYAQGALLAGRMTSRSDIWKFPATGSPADNVRDAIRVTRQTAQVQTPSPSPDDREVVYLSDSAGHANLWIARTDGSWPRQLTFERDPDVGIGAPKWSPTGDDIVFIMSRRGTTDLWTIKPDGSDLRRVVRNAWGPCWSGDGRWIYCHSLVEGAERVEKIRLEGGQPIIVRPELGSRQPAVAADGSALYYEMPLRLTTFGYWAADHEIWRAAPEDGPAQKLAQIPAARIPISPGMLHMALSPDGSRLAMPLIDGATTNIWALPAAGGRMEPLTDFGTQPIIIGRSVAWSGDGHSLYAAVAETETDIILLDGLI